MMNQIDGLITKGDVDEAASMWLNEREKELFKEEKDYCRVENALCDAVISKINSKIEDDDIDAAIAEWDSKSKMELFEKEEHRSRVDKALGDGVIPLMDSRIEQFIAQGNFDQAFMIWEKALEIPPLKEHPGIEMLQKRLDLRCKRCDLADFRLTNSFRLNERERIFFSFINSCGEELIVTGQFRHEYRSGTQGHMEYCTRVRVRRPNGDSIVYFDMENRTQYKILDCLGFCISANSKSIAVLTELGHWDWATTYDKKRRKMYSITGLMRLTYEPNGTWESWRMLLRSYNKFYDVKDCLFNAKGVYFWNDDHCYVIQAPDYKKLKKLTRKGMSRSVLDCIKDKMWAEIRMDAERENRNKPGFKNKLKKNGEERFCYDVKYRDDYCVAYLVEEISSSKRDEVLRYSLKYRYEYRGTAEWDEGADKILQIFKTLFPKPDEDDVELFREILRQHSFGNITPEGAERKLKEKTK